MNHFKQRGKYKIIQIIVAVLLFVLPTVITFSIMEKSESVNEKGKELVFSSERNDAAGAVRSDAEVSNEVSDAGQAEAAEAGQAETADVEKDHITTNVLRADNGGSLPVVVATDTDAVYIEPGEPNGKKVYLTFDDGPSSGTRELLEILDRYDVKATFFVVKNENNEEALKAIAEGGHTIGLHSASHVYSDIYKNSLSFKCDVKLVHDWVESVTGIDSKYYRFPGGSSYGLMGFDKDKAIDYLNEKGYKYIDWNAETSDAVYPNMAPEQMAQRALSYIHSNTGDSVVLMHDQEGRYNTIKALPIIIETLIREGYEICPVDDDTPEFHQYPEEIITD